MATPKYPKVVGMDMNISVNLSVSAQRRLVRLRANTTDRWWWFLEVSVPCLQLKYERPSVSLHRYLTPKWDSVFRAVNVEDHRVAACKMIALTESTNEKDRKSIDKEMRVHSALKHRHVLEFMNAVVVEPKHRDRYVPGIYMLLEFAAGGDLFDKIGDILTSPD